MATGIVKWFNPKKGYGFIKQDDSKNDIFVHINAVLNAGLQTLSENQKVSYEVENVKGRSSAINLKAVK